MQWLATVGKGLWLFAKYQREFRQRGHMVAPENSLEMTNLPGAFHLSHEVRVVI